MTGGKQVVVQNRIASASGKAFGWQRPIRDVRRAQSYKRSKQPWGCPFKWATMPPLPLASYLLIRSSPAGVGRSSTANVVTGIWNGEVSVPSCHTPGNV